MGKSRQQVASNNRCHRVLRFALLTGLLPIILSACAFKSFSPTPLAEAPFLQRQVVQERDGLRIAAAVPNAQETLDLTGIDLYAQGIQPVWLNVENNSPQRVRIAHWSIDRDYFSPIEVAYRNRKSFQGSSYSDMERWFYDNRLERHLAPGQSGSGFVYTHVMAGTKGFNLDLFSRHGSHNFTFFVPLEGFVADYQRVDFEALYTDAQIREIDVHELQRLLEEDLPCCAADATGTKEGGLFNIVLVGTTTALRRSLLRAGWQETGTDEDTSLIAQSQFFAGRPPDGVFTSQRKDSEERLEIRLWLAPWQGKFEGRQIWIGQAGFSTGNRFFFEHAPAALARFAREDISADVDSAAGYVLQKFWYNQSLAKAGFVGGIEASTPEDPHESFTGARLFTKGGRIVMLLSEKPVSMDETIILFNRLAPAQ